MWQSSKVEVMIWEQLLKFHMLHNKVGEICEMAVLETGVKKQQWKVQSFEKEVLVAITAVQPVESSLEVEPPSSMLHKARLVVAFLANWTKADRRPNLLVPETTDAAVKWSAILDYRNANIQDVQAALERKRPITRNNFRSPGPIHCWH